jgi:hypothetical protein
MTIITFFLEKRIYFNIPASASTDACSCPKLQTATPSLANHYYKLNEVKVSTKIKDLFR